MPKKYFHIVTCPLSKRQRFLYEDYIGRRNTREQLASGSFLSMMGVLMQLRKVCNHPDLFETRPIRTPFICECIELAIPRLVERMVQIERGVVFSHALNRCMWEQDTPNRSTLEQNTLYGSTLEQNTLYESTLEHNPPNRSTLEQNTPNRSTFEHNTLTDAALDAADWRRSLQIFPSFCRRVALVNDFRLVDRETDSLGAALLRRSLQPNSNSFLDEIVELQTTFTPDSALIQEVHAAAFNSTFFPAPSSPPSLVPPL